GSSGDVVQLTAQSSKGSTRKAENHSINLVLRSAHVILRRACPTWGARLEGLRASRRTATSETEPAAILRDGAPQVGCSRLAYLMCRSRVNPRSVRLLQDEVC